MFYRLLFSFFIIISCASCKNDSFIFNRNTQAIDTVVNFKTVDVSPYFKVCENLLGEAKTKCFRVNIHQKLTKELKLLTSDFKEEELVELNVVLSIDNKGVISLKEIEYFNDVYKEASFLREEILIAIKQMPQLYPALKRGIPVATEYKLPIRIVPKERS